MNRIKIIGIGSPFGNDQLGWQVVDRLENTMPGQVENNKFPKRQLSFIHSDRPGIRLLELLKDTEIAILVDAVDNKECAGQILQFEQNQLISADCSLSSHDIGVSEVLSLAQALDELPQEIVLFGIAVNSGDPQPISNKKIVQLCKRIDQYLNQTCTMH